MRESMEIVYPRTAAERAMKLQGVLLRATSDVERKSSFPSQLANPAQHAGFALSHRLYGY